MFLFKSIVGKLWMTIIALVAVVLIILGLFLFRYIDTQFPNQSGKLIYKAERLAALQNNWKGPEDLTAANAYLALEDSGMAILKRQTEAIDTNEMEIGGKRMALGDLFSASQLQSIRDGKQVTSTYRQMEGGSYVLLVLPLLDQEGVGVTRSLILYQSNQIMEDTQLYVKKVFIYVTIMGFLLTTIFAFFLIIRINRPLIDLQKAAGFIRSGDFKKRVRVHSEDEIGQLGHIFNDMADQLGETIREARNEKDNLSSVLRSMGDAVLSFGVDGRVIFLNPQGEKLLAEWSRFGWEDSAADSDNEDGADTGTQLITRSAAESGLKLIPGPLLSLFMAAVRDRKETVSELLVFNSVWSVAVAPLYAEGMVRGAVAVLRDETEKTRSEKFRKDFVANVSHELRTPLSMLQGYSEALLDDIAGTAEERRELAQIIYEESLRMGRLVHDLLDLARMEGHVELHLQPLELDNLLRRVQRKFAALCKDKEIELQVELAEEMTHLEQADEDRLEQVLTNLLDNAIRHTGEGGSITLRTLSATWQGMPAVTIEVEDKGEGIPAADLPFVFERFYKADKARTRKRSGGTGLGLAIVKNIVEAHKGHIEARSKVNQGTVFSITLPLRWKEEPS